MLLPFQFSISSIPATLIMIGRRLMAEIEDLGKTILGVGLGASLAQDLGLFSELSLPALNSVDIVDIPQDLPDMISQVDGLVASGLVDASIGLAVQIAQLGLIIAYASWLFKKGLGLDK